MIDYRQHLSSDPKIMRGKPVIRGTRITVELLLRKFAGGYSIAEIMEMYPHVTNEGVLSALAYAADVLASEEQIVAA